MTHYEIILYWSKADRAFIAEVLDLPGCKADGKTRSEAIVNIEIIIAEWIETAKNLGRVIPKPKYRQKIDKDTVVKLVRKALKKFSDAKLEVELVVDPKILRYDLNEDWWQVPVKVVGEFKNRYDFYTILADAEEELQSDERRIQLVPG